MPESNPPAKVTIYRTTWCAYCVAAARLLDKRGIPYVEIYLDGKPEERTALEERTNWRTVPQIFVGERFVGGYTDLAALDRSGELQRMLQDAA